MSAIAGRDNGIGKGSGNHLVGAEVELLQDATVGDVEQHSIVGEIVGDEQPVASLPGNHGQAGGIWDRRSRRRFADSESDLLARRNFLWRHFYEAFRS